MLCKVAVEAALSLDLQFRLVSHHVSLQSLNGLPQDLNVLLLLFDYFEELVLIKVEASWVIL